MKTAAKKSMNLKVAMVKEEEETLETNKLVINNNTSNSKAKNRPEVSLTNIWNLNPIAIG